MVSGALELAEETGAGAARIPAGLALRAARAAVVVALLPVSAYLVPRVVDMVSSPTGMQESIDLGERYNPRIAQVVELEKQTLAKLDALDRVDGSLAQVRGTVGSVSGKLEGLTARISGDVQTTLAASVAEVDKLLAQLRSLRASLAAVGKPVEDIDRVIAEARATMERILAEARLTGADVKRARASAANSADNVAGPRP